MTYQSDPLLSLIVIADVILVLKLVTTVYLVMFTELTHQLVVVLMDIMKITVLVKYVHTNV
jgi:hypothetical protein